MFDAPSQAHTQKKKIKANKSKTPAARSAAGLAQKRKAKHVNSNAKNTLRLGRHPPIRKQEAQERYQ
jgi:hypothetical protein